MLFFLKVEKKLKIESIIKVKTGKIGVLQKAIMLITTKPNNANLNIYKSFIVLKVKLIIGFVRGVISYLFIHCEKPAIVSFRKFNFYFINFAISKFVIQS